MAAAWEAKLQELKTQQAETRHAERAKLEAEIEATRERAGCELAAARLELQAAQEAESHSKSAKSRGDAELEATVASLQASVASTQAQRDELSAALAQARREGSVGAAELAAAQAARTLRQQRMARSWREC